MAVKVGLVGPKARPKGVVDGQQVNIPVPHMYAMAGRIGKIFMPVNEFRSKQ